MKLGHYLKLPPRTMFFGQLIATMWSVVVQVATFRCKFSQRSHVVFLLFFFL
jgi:hypothetical protein